MSTLKLTEIEPIRVEKKTENDIYPEFERKKLETRYLNKIEINHDLSRQLVSFQANKSTPYYRWFKYKEGFSQPLVKYLISKLTKKTGHLFDPFTGTGSALFTARSLGWKTTGIELLPVGIKTIKARLAAENVSHNEFKIAIDKIREKEWEKTSICKTHFNHVNITRGAFSVDTELKLNKYLTFCENEFQNKDLLILLEFAAFSILESISFTRKDGQYLRWDYRSGRKYSSKIFDKGSISTFDEAIVSQLVLMYEDMKHIPLDLFEKLKYETGNEDKYNIELYEDSCLTRLRKIRSRSFNFILTSPPYCNRYDYTRTYALELIFCGANEEKIKYLRQEMLSCTVENKDKTDQLYDFYKEHKATHIYNKAVESFENQKALQEVLEILDDLRIKKQLNNNSLVRMVRNYFLEMSLVIHECARIMRSGAFFVMVNDNVSYNGHAVPVDLILSEFAESAGLNVEKIWTLEKGKGNSSQQMGRHGRKELRKCVYVWSKPKGKQAI